MSLARSLSRFSAVSPAATRLSASAPKAFRQFSRLSPLASDKAQILLEDKESGFGFIRHNPRAPKPRKSGVTEIRGPYYSAYGKRHLQDVLETMGYHVDGLKFAGGSFSLMPEKALKEMIELAHSHDVYVSTGGWMEHVLTQSDVRTAVDKYLQKCKDIGFDVIEISSGFLSLPNDDWLRIVDKVHSHGMKAKPELGIQFGAGGDTKAGDLEAIGTSSPARVVSMGKRFIDAGVEKLMIESEGITENVKSWRTDVIQAILNEIPMENVMFEAADPQVFNW